MNADVRAQALGTSARVVLIRESSKQPTTDRGHAPQIRPRGRARAWPKCMKENPYFSDSSRRPRPFTGPVLAPRRSAPETVSWPVGVLTIAIVVKHQHHQPGATSTLCVFEHLLIAG